MKTRAKRKPTDTPLNTGIFVILACAIVGGSATTCNAESGTSSSLKLTGDDDAVFKAMKMEMQRGLKDLRVEDQPPPYYMSYSIKQVQEIQLESKLGSPVSKKERNRRFFKPIIKVGSYDFDNTPLNSGPSSTATEITVDDDVLALRRFIWSHTDSSYKGAVRSLQSKKSYILDNHIDKKFAEMSKEPPVVSVEGRGTLSLDEKEWDKVVQELSAIFLKYPTLTKSQVSMQARQVTRWFINSEGSQIRYTHPDYAILFEARGQAGNAPVVADFNLAAAYDEKDLPSEEQLKQQVEKLAENVNAIMHAPKSEAYCGPVIFEGEAAAELVAQLLANNFGEAEQSIGYFGNSNPLLHSFGRRVLNKDLTIVDDPTVQSFKGKPLYGNFFVDDDGVPAKKVILVEDGVVKNFCQSRIPTRASDHSNGHSFRGYGDFDIVQLSSRKTSSPEQMRARATELAKDAGLDYFILIRRISDEFHMHEMGTSSAGGQNAPGYTKVISDPLLVYKVDVTTGKEELVRGLEFTSMSLRAFRDIQAVGDDAAPWLIEPADGLTRDLITPSLLVGEVELEDSNSDHATAPLLPSPVSLEGTQTKLQVSEH